MKQEGQMKKPGKGERAEPREAGDERKRGEKPNERGGQDLIRTQGEKGPKACFLPNSD